MSAMLYFILGVIALVTSIMSFSVAFQKKEEPALVIASGTVSNTELIEEQCCRILVYSPESIMRNGIATKALAGTRSATLAERKAVVADGGTVMLVQMLLPDLETSPASPTPKKEGQ